MLTRDLNLLYNIMTTSLAMFGLGGQEMILVFFIILLLFGAKKLPQLAKGIGKSMGEFKKAREDFENEISRAEDDVTISDSSERKKES